MTELIGGERTITHDENTGNVRIVGMISPRRVISASDLAEVFGIDLDEWEMIYQKPNKWDGFFKDANKEPVIVELYQVKCTLVRRGIVPVEYTVRPVRINARYPFVITSGKTKKRRSHYSIRS